MTTTKPFVGVSSVKFEERGTPLTSGSRQFVNNSGRVVTTYLKVEEAQDLINKLNDALTRNALLKQNGTTESEGVRIDMHYGLKKLPDDAKKNAGGIISSAFYVIKAKGEPAQGAATPAAAAF